MRAACILLCALLVPVASADNVYTYTFQSLPPGWAAQAGWTFGLSGAVLSISASGGPGMSVSSEIQSDSAPLTMYSGTDSVNVSLTCTYSLTGWYSSGESYASVSAYALLDGVSHTIMYDSESWGFPNQEPSAVYDCSFPASEGQSLVFSFTGSAGAFGAYAHVDWNITSLVVTVFGPTSLDLQTWGGIKSLF
jgi:hypothetical protein